MKFRRLERDLFGTWLYATVPEDQKKAIKILGTATDGDDVSHARRLLLECLARNIHTEMAVTSLLNLGLVGYELPQLTDFLLRPDRDSSRTRGQTIDAIAALPIRDAMLFLRDLYQHPDASISLKVMIIIAVINTGDPARLEPLINWIDITSEVVEIERLHQIIRKTGDTPTPTDSLLPVFLVALLKKFQNDAPDALQYRYQTYFILSWFRDHPHHIDEAVIDRFVPLLHDPPLFPHVKAALDQVAQQTPSHPLKKILQEKEWESIRHRVETRLAAGDFTDAATVDHITDEVLKTIIRQRVVEMPETEPSDVVGNVIQNVLRTLGLD
ncbi:MAG: hypothetical protein D6675_15675 [Gemmatimonadetes bacterium]|nr:MAG: hypothetical protein D6675_15675 [Gemmatimonadota bacterium]